jgi:hypothetical protein
MSFAATATMKFYKYKCPIKCDVSLHGNACSWNTGPSSLWQPTPSSLCRCHSPPFVTRAHKRLPIYVTLQRGAGYSSEIWEYEYFWIRESIRAVARAKFWIHKWSDLTMFSSSPSNPIHACYFPTFVFMSYHTLTSPSPPHYLTNWYILKWIIRSWWNIFTEIFITIQLVKGFSTFDESQKFNPMFHPIFPLESILRQFNRVPKLHTPFL